jgi:hypothetical protein
MHHSGASRGEIANVCPISSLAGLTHASIEGRSFVSVGLPGQPNNGDVVALADRHGRLDQRHRDRLAAVAPFRGQAPGSKRWGRRGFL